MVAIISPVINIRIKEDPIPKTYEEFVEGLERVCFEYRSNIVYPVENGEIKFNVQSTINGYLQRMFSADLLIGEVECLVRGGPGSNSEGQALMEAGMQCENLRCRNIEATYNNDYNRQVIIVTDEAGKNYLFPYTLNIDNPEEMQILFIYQDKNVEDLTKVWKGLDL